MCLSVVGQPIIIINDLTVATDLLEKRSAIYSSRKDSPTVSPYVAAHSSMFVSYALIYTRVALGLELRLHALWVAVEEPPPLVLAAR